MSATYFKSPAEFRKWLEKHHATKSELLVGFHKVDSGKPSLTWPQSVDEALCFGWIDGIRRRVDETRYTIRFTPRRPGSAWSAVNIKRVAALTAEGRMKPPGLEAFAAAKVGKVRIYSYERLTAELDEPSESLLKRNAAAWAFFQKLPPAYRKRLCWWVMSAKKPETRIRRLERLVVDCAAGRRPGEGL